MSVAARRADITTTAVAARWLTLHLLRPYLRNHHVDKGKWFLMRALNAKPGEEFARYGKRLISTRYGSVIYGDMLYSGHRFLYFTGEYEVALSRLFARTLGPGWCFVDVGANIGYYTILAAKLADKVVSLEPNPGTRRLLEENVAANGFDNVTILPFGLSDVATEMHLFQEGNDIGGATFRSAAPDAHSFAVRTATGDDLLQDDDGDRRLLIKIDTEGWEYNVLCGLRHILGRPTTTVVAEITDAWLQSSGASARQLFDLMTDHGYHAFQVYLRRSVLRNGIGLRKLTGPLDTFQYDALFTRCESTAAFWSWVSNHGRDVESDRSIIE